MASKSGHFGYNLHKHMRLAFAATGLELNHRGRGSSLDLFGIQRNDPKAQFVDCASCVRMQKLSLSRSQHVSRVHDI